MGLDVVGQRWSLLIIRELLAGPRRFSEIEAALPGIGPNLLSDRLQELTAAGVVTREATVPGGRREHYLLTESGQELRPALLALARWGLRNAPAPGDEAGVVAPTWALFAVEALVDGQTPPSGVDEVYEFHVEDQVFHISARNRRAQVIHGPSPIPPDLTVRAAADAFAHIGAGNLSPLAAMDSGAVAMDGPLTAVLRCCALLGLAL